MERESHKLPQQTWSTSSIGRSIRRMPRQTNPSRCAGPNLPLRIFRPQGQSLVIHRPSLLRWHAELRRDQLLGLDWDERRRHPVSQRRQRDLRIVLRGLPLYNMYDQFPLARHGQRRQPSPQDRLHPVIRSWAPHYEEDTSFEACAPQPSTLVDPPLHFAKDTSTGNVAWCSEALPVPNDNVTQLDCALGRERSLSWMRYEFHLSHCEAFALLDLYGNRRDRSEFNRLPGQTQRLLPQRLRHDSPNDLRGGPPSECHHRFSIHVGRARPSISAPIAPAIARYPIRD